MTNRTSAIRLLCPIPFLTSLHSHCLRMVDTFEIVYPRNQSCIVSELIAGPTLHKYLRENGRCTSPLQIRHFALHLLEAVTCKSSKLNQFIPHALDTDAPVGSSSSFYRPHPHQHQGQKHYGSIFKRTEGNF
jgi:serine/threonine protein kinase